MVKGVLTIALLLFDSDPYKSTLLHFLQSPRNEETYSPTVLTNELTILEQSCEYCCIHYRLNGLVINCVGN